MPRLIWHERDSFYAINNARQRSNRDWQIISFDITDHDIYREIPVSHTADPDDGDFPSSVHRWYGQIDDRLFALDVFHDFDRNQCHLIIPYSDLHQFAWQTLWDLTVLPPAILEGGTKGISNDAAQRESSVFRHDDRGFDYAIYGGTSKADAETLLKYLHDRGFTFEYSLGLPEPDINWVAKEISNGVEGHRAMYNSRHGTLDVACKMSKASCNEFLVYSLAPESDSRRYTIRQGTVTNATSGRSKLSPWPT